MPHNIDSWAETIQSCVGGEYFSFHKIIISRPHFCRYSICNSPDKFWAEEKNITVFIWLQNGSVTSQNSLSYLDSSGKLALDLWD